MERRAVIILVLMAGLGGSVAAAGCTAPFTVGVGGSSTSSNTGGASSASGSSSSSSSSGVVKMCDQACPDGYYCLSPLCGGAGTCEAITKDQLAYQPMCGCDDVTYWNGTVAGPKVAIRASTHECLSVSHPCTPGTCATGECSLREATTATSCNATPPSAGTCWVLPASCLMTPNSGYQCPSNTCMSACDLIRAQKPWYQAVCP